MAAGVLLAIAGVWVLSQVLGGNALGRLGVTGEPTEAGTKPTSSTGAAPNPVAGLITPSTFA